MTTSPHVSAKLASFGTTVFAQMSALAAQTGAINLGQGFPDTDGPTEVSDAAVEAIRAGHNQYPPLPGVPALRAAVAEHQARFWGQTLDPDTEVLITAGATEALTAAMLGLCDTGAEVVAFEPTYDSYAAAVAMAGAKLRPVVLRPESDGVFRFDEADLRAAIRPSTRLLLLNTPHNPTGKVFDDAELALIAELCVTNDVIAVTDEVYEHLVFDGTHRQLASFPGMAERTVTISSAGKTFSFTGWKVGWACGPSELLRPIMTAKQFMTFVNAAPFQHAIAVGLALGDDFYSNYTASHLGKRDLLGAYLRAAGFREHAVQGTYFSTVDIRPIVERHPHLPGDGVAFCLALPEVAGVVAVPTQVFHDDPRHGTGIIRFCFAKTDDTLTSAGERLVEAFA